MICVAEKHNTMITLWWICHKRSFRACARYPWFPGRYF